MTEGSTGDIILKEAPERLREKADHVSQEIVAMTDAFGELAAVISRTSHYWIGEAGDHYRTLYTENKEEIEEMLRRLGQHPGWLLQKAQISEPDGQDKTQPVPLPGDVII